MSEMYNTSIILECITLPIFMLTLFLGRGKRWNTITGFFAVIVLLSINLVQLTLEIALEQSIFFSVFLSITWTLYLIVGARDFWHAIKRK